MYERTHEAHDAGKGVVIYVLVFGHIRLPRQHGEEVVVSAGSGIRTERLDETGRAPLRAQNTLEIGAVDPRDGGR